MLTEHEEQKALVRWASYQKWFPLFFAIPNGGHRHKAVAAKLKAEGVKAGIPDLFLAMPNDKFHGLFIELKSEKGRLSELQKETMANFIAQGYCCMTCRGFDEARLAIKGYINGLQQTEQ